MIDIVHQTIYESISKVLLGDDDLKAMLRYTDKNLNIRRGFTVVKEKWDRLVCYYLQSEIPFGDVSMKILEIPLIVRVYDKSDDLQVGEYGERVKLLLDGANLTVTDKITCYDCSYTGEIISTSWNDEFKSFEKVLRFKLLVRVDGVVGNSGAPTTNRQRDYH